MGEAERAIKGEQKGETEEIQRICQVEIYEAYRKEGQ